MMTVIAMRNYEKFDQTDNIRLVSTVRRLDDTDDDDSDCDENCNEKCYQIDDITIRLVSTVAGVVSIHEFHVWQLVGRFHEDDDSH